MRIYRVKLIWRVSMVLLSAIFALIVIQGWIDGLNSGEVVGGVCLATVLALPFVCYMWFVYPRVRVILTEEDIQLHALTTKKLAFKDITEFKVHANAVLIRSPKTRMWIARSLERQWEIADLVARRLVAIGQLADQQYKELAKFFHD